MTGPLLYASHKKPPYSYCTKEGKVSEWGGFCLHFTIWSNIIII